MKTGAVFLIAVLSLPATTYARDIVVLGLFTGKAVVQIDGTRRVLSVGQSSPEGVRLVNSDSEAAVLEVNGRQARYTLGAHIGSSFEAAKGEEVRIWPDNGGMYATDGTINGQPIGFLVDTGATLISMNADDARRLGIDFVKDGRPAMLETASGRERAFQVMIDSVSVGGIKLHNVAAVVLEGSMPSTALLGMSFLNRVDMQRDGQALVLKSKW